MSSPTPTSSDHTAGMRVGYSRSAESPSQIPISAWPKVTVQNDDRRRKRCSTLVRRLWTGLVTKPARDRLVSPWLLHEPGSKLNCAYEGPLADLSLCTRALERLSVSKHCLTVSRRCVVPWFRTIWDRLATRLLYMDGFVACARCAE